jgi:hypothetical protein
MTYYSIKVEMFPDRFIQVKSTDTLLEALKYLNAEFPNQIAMVDKVKKLVYQNDKVLKTYNL